MKLSIERTITYQPPGDAAELRITLASCNVLTTGRYEHTYLRAAREWFKVATDKTMGDTLKDIKETKEGSTPSDDAVWLLWLVDKVLG